jgi:hypothetical protein
MKRATRTSSAFNIGSLEKDIRPIGLGFPGLTFLPTSS